MSFLSKARFVEQNTPPDSTVRPHVTQIEQIAERLALGLCIGLTHGRKQRAGENEGIEMAIQGVRAAGSTLRYHVKVTFISREAFQHARTLTGWAVWDDAGMVLEARYVDDMIHVPASETYFGDWTLFLPTPEIWS